MHIKHIKSGVTFGHDCTWYWQRKNAPSIDWERMKKDGDMMNNITQYLNSLVIIINPDLDARHPCQKRPEELRDDL